MPDFTGFDPKSLLTTTVKGKLDTKLIPIPLDNGDEFLAVCRKIDIRTITSKKSQEQYCSLSTNWEILDDHVKSVTHMDTPTARYDFLLEVDPQKGLVVGPAKNVRLGRLLEATGINGKEWSLSMLEGMTATVKIKHRPDEDDPDIIYNEIIRVGPAR